MKHYRYSIRTVLLMIISVLNLLIAAPLGYFAYKSFGNYHNAQEIRHVTDTLNQLYTAKKYLSLERAAALSILYAPPGSFEALNSEIQENREKSRETIKKVMNIVRQTGGENVIPAIGDFENATREFDALRTEMDEAVDAPGEYHSSSLPDRYFSQATGMIEKIDRIIEVYATPIIRFNPEITRQMRLTRFIWEISEYAGREYAILGRLIAQNKFPDRQTREKLMSLRGRIQYGLELTHGAVENSPWREELISTLEEAETHYLMVFEQIKDVFYQPSTVPISSLYPITVEMWLQIASEAVNSIHAMTDGFLLANTMQVNAIEQDAISAIYVSLFFFLSAVILSAYTWWLITARVVRPVNSMVEALYKETQLSDRDIKADPRLDEISKLSQVLEVFQKNSRQLQKERDRAHAASIAKSEFLANMSHEIRTPMNVVVGLANILEKTQPLTGKQAEFIKTLQISADSLLSLINDLLDFSKIEAQNFELEETRFNLEKLVEDIVRIKDFKAREKKLIFITDVEGIRGKEYIGDPTRISQILVNLCGNAIKFTEQGSITLKITGRPSEKIGYDDIEIIVSDTGIGIPEEKIDIIFEKFTQADASIVRKYGGTGLGLAITKNLVEMMGGDIKIEKSTSAGTTFKVSFPLKLRAQQNLFDLEESTRKDPADDISKGRVLLAEDYRPNALVAGAFLDEFGYQYDIAGSGHEAVQKFMEKEYDAILMDIQMPGMDGYEATRTIRKYEKETGRTRVKIIGLTAHVSTGDYERCIQAGMDDYISKPFEQKELKKKLRA